MAETNQDGDGLEIRRMQKIRTRIEYTLIDEWRILKDASAVNSLNTGNDNRKLRVRKLIIPAAEKNLSTDFGTQAPWRLTKECSCDRIRQPTVHGI